MSRACSLIAATVGLCARLPGATTELRARLLIPAVVGLCALLPGAAWGAQTASISAGFTPERLGAPTTVSLGFGINAQGGQIPSALTAIDFQYPPTLGLGTSGLGLAACNPARLQLDGPKVCPENSRMGSGSALAKFQVSPEVSEEGASIDLFAGPSQNGYVKLLVAATAVYPVAGRFVMSALLLPGHLRFSVPLVPGIPEGPDVAVVKVHVTIGGELTYYERVHGKRVPYRPRGIELPRRCPRGGFRFAGKFSFLDGSQATARTVVRCPRRAR